MRTQGRVTGGDLLATYLDGAVLADGRAAPVSRKVDTLAGRHPQRA